MLEEKGIRTGTGTIDVSVGEARVKLGTNGYSSVAHAEGVLGEGSFTCDVEGNATFTWDHCIAFDKAIGQWVTSDKKSILPSFFCLADGTLCINSFILSGHFIQRVSPDLTLTIYPARP